MASHKGQDVTKYPTVCQRIHYDKYSFDQNANNAKDEKLSPGDLRANSKSLRINRII